MTTPNDDADTNRSVQFDRYILDGIPRLRRLGYNPGLFLSMVEQHGGVVAATKRLLADPRHTSYGFEWLWRLGELGSSVEFAVCLPWFEPLFSVDEREEAARRLILQDFPLADRLAAAARQPPTWESPR